MPTLLCFSKPQKYDSLTFPSWEEVSEGVGHPSTSHSQGSTGEMYRLVTTKTAKNEELICKGQSVSALDA